MSQTLKIISVNTWGGKLLDQLTQFLQQENPDIFLLQEVYSTQDNSLDSRYHSLETLIETFSDYSYHYAPTFSAGYLDGKVKAGNAIFSRAPIFDTKVTFFDVSYIEKWAGANPPGDFSQAPRNMQQLTINHPEVGEVQVANVHGIWGFDGRDSDRRKAMTRTIVDELKGKQRIIIGGDFNMDSDTAAIKTMTESYMPTFADLTTSFNSRIAKDVLAGHAVDKMFVSRDWEVLRAECLDIDVSDHLPLVLELKPR